MKAPVRKFKLYVAGKWCREGVDAGHDKFTGETFANVPVASRETTEGAIRAAHEAFPAWSRTPAHKRYKILSNVSRLLEERQEESPRSSAGRRGRRGNIRWGSVPVGRDVRFSRRRRSDPRETVPMDASFAGEGRVGYWLRVPWAWSPRSPLQLPPQPGGAQGGSRAAWEYAGPETRFHNAADRRSCWARSWRRRGTPGSSTSSSGRGNGGRVADRRPADLEDLLHRVAPVGSRSSARRD